MVTKTGQPDAEQLARTVEMFEAIVESQPDDYQSLAILRDTYDKLGRQEDSRRATLRLIKTYENAGQLPSALAECEVLLNRHPDDAEIRATLAGLQERLQLAEDGTDAGVSSRADSTRSSEAAAVSAAAGTASPTSLDVDAALKGTEAFARVLIAEKILTEQAKHPLMEKLRAKLSVTTTLGETATLFQLMVEEQLAQHDDLLSLIVTKSVKPYLPLSCYDVDRDVGFLLPGELCFTHCIVPFDLIGRSVLIATWNPFDRALLTHVKQMLDYNLFWYISPPEEILGALRRVHGIESKKGGG